MAFKPLRPCRHPGCSALTGQGYCQRHAPEHRRCAERKESAQWHSWYSKPIWTDDLRPAQLLREPFCRSCARQGHRARANTVDHVVPFRGDWKLFVDPSNHQSLCKRCHDRKTARGRTTQKLSRFCARIGHKSRKTRARGRPERARAGSLRDPPPSKSSTPSGKDRGPKFAGDFFPSGKFLGRKQDRKQDRKQERKQDRKQERKRGRKRERRRRRTACGMDGKKLV